MKIKVNADLLRIAAGFISKEETRYYLQGVCVQPHQLQGVTLCATDGHRMFIAHDRDGQCTGHDEASPPIIKLEKHLLDMCKAPRGEIASRTLSVDAAGTATVHSSDGVLLGSAMRVLIDGTFPDWRRVVPGVTDANAPATFNATYLSDFTKAATELAKLEGRKTGALAVFGATEAPAIVRFMGVDNAFGVLMPMRDNTPRALPWFLNAAPAA